jgi:hypothetical protein
MRTTVIKSSLAALSAYWVLNWRPNPLNCQLCSDYGRVSGSTQKASLAGSEVEVAMNFPFGDDIIS